MTPPPPHVVIDELLAEAGWVRRLAHRLAGDVEAGDELAQRTLLIALARWTGGAGLRPWLRRVLERTARHRRREDARRRDRERAASRLEVTDEDAEQLVLQVEEQQRLAQLVMGLAQPYRDVVLRRYYRGESVMEIAQATGRTPATVRSQLSRGHARLREALEARAHEEQMDARSLLLLAAAAPPAVVHSAPAIPAAVPLTLLTMKTSTQIAIVASLALIAVFGLRSMGLDLGRESVATIDVAEAVPVEALAAVEDEGGGVARIEVEAPATALETSGALPEAQLEEGAEAVVAVPGVLRLVAVDEHDAPLSGARLQPLKRSTMAPDGPPSRLSREDGRIAMEIEPARVRPFLGGHLRLRHALEARYRVTAFLPIAPGPGESVDLGRVTLLPGGALAGRVVNSAGMPIEGALVMALGEVAESALGELKLVGPDLKTPRVRTWTDGAGRFELDGLPPGSVRLAAGADGQLWTISGLLQVEASRTQGGIELALEPIPAAKYIQGVVLDPVGRPVAGVTVDYAYSHVFDEELVTDKDGRFSMVSSRGLAVTFVARSPGGAHGRSNPVVWSAGDPDVILRLRDEARVALMVRDSAGQPVAKARVMVRGAETAYLGASWLATDEEGELALPTLGVPMLVNVGSPAHVSEELGPWQPGAVPDPLEVVLESKPSIRGVVLADGKPVAGATVEICRDCLDISEMFVPVSAGFPLRLFGMGQFKTTADAEGRFELFTDVSYGAVVLLGDADGWATTELRVDREPGSDTAGIELRLVRGGALEGQLSTVDGAIHEGVVVAISRGDGRPLSTRTDEGGRYRFDRLTPGPWRVEVRSTEPAFEVVSSAQNGRDAFRWDCEVLGGETTTYDLTDERLAPVLFDGRLRLGGAPASGWSARVIMPNHQVPDRPLPAVLLDMEGRFDFELPSGAYELELRSPEGSAVEFIVHRRFKAEGGPFTWEEDVAVGLCEGEVEVEAARLSLFRGSTRSATWERVIFDRGLDGSFQVQQAPAGRCYLQSETDGSRGIGWGAIRVIEVTAGE